MIKEKLQNAINEQINWEMYSSYLYLSMATYFDSIDLDGYANFFYVQAKEENDHAMKFVNYLLERGGKVVFEQINKPESSFTSCKQVFELTLEHEELVTSKINTLMDLAVQESDHSMISFMKWYVDEQVEEEANVGKILNKIKLIGDNGTAIYMMNQELAQRQYVAPVVG